MYWSPLTEDIKQNAQETLRLLLNLQTFWNKRYRRNGFTLWRSGFASNGHLSIIIPYQVAWRLNSQWYTTNIDVGGDGGFSGWILIGSGGPEPHSPPLEYHHYILRNISYHTIIWFSYTWGVRPALWVVGWDASNPKKCFDYHSLLS